MEKADDRIQGAVPATYVRLLYEYLDAAGADSRAVLGAPPPDPEPGMPARIPVTVWRRMLRQAADHLADPYLGLHLGRTIKPAHFGTLGYIFHACDNLAAALSRLQIYQRLVYDVNPMRTARRSQGIVLEWGQSRGRPGPLVDETAVTALVQFARDLTGQRLEPAGIDFINPWPARLAPYETYFGCRVRFACDTTRVILPDRLLAQPLRRPDVHLLQLLEQEARRLLSRLPDRDPLLHQVRQAVIRLAREADAELPRIAAELHMSERTLHRRLRERNSNFRRLRDDTLRRAAEDYLADPHLQLAEVAQLLGYSEQSAFNRAFKRWTGTTPHVYRAHLQDP